MSEPHTVLLVEDNLADVRLTSEALQEATIPCYLQVARNGAEALGLLRERASQPDLIILDLELPGLSGFEVLTQLEADPVLRSIPVAMFTAEDDDRLVREAYELGASCYLTKPRDISDFVTVVRELEAFWFGTVRLPDRDSKRGEPLAGGGSGR